jgi:hypothetical protein
MDAATTPIDTNVQPEANSAEQNVKTTPSTETESKNYTVKVNGKEKVLNEAEYRKYVQLGLSAQEKFEAAARERAEINKMKDELEKSDWFDQLKKRVQDPKQRRQLIEDKLLEMVEEDALSPQEREYRELKAEKEAKAAAEKEEKMTKEEKEKAAKETKAIEESQNKIRDQIVQVLDKSNLPRSATIFKAVAQEMLSASHHDIDLSPEDAVKIVEKEYFSNIAGTLSDLPIGRVKAILGEKLLAALRDDAVSKVKAQEPFKDKTKPAPRPSKQSVQEDEKIPMSQYFRNLRLGK